MQLDNKHFPRCRENFFRDRERKREYAHHPSHPAALRNKLHGGGGRVLRKNPGEGKNRICHSRQQEWVGRQSRVVGRKVRPTSSAGVSPETPILKFTFVTAALGWYQVQPATALPVRETESIGIDCGLNPSMTD